MTSQKFDCEKTLRMMKRIFVLLFFVGCTFALQAQVPAIPTPPEVQAQLDDLGVTEDEIQQRLLEKGIDINNIDPANIGEVEAALEEVIAEIEAENAAGGGTSPGEPIKSGTFVEDEPNTPQQDTTATPEAPKETTPPPTTETKPAKNEEKPKEETADAADGPKMPLQIFGHNVFVDKGGSSLNLDAKNMKAPANYLLGPGDEVAVSVFGLSQANYNFEINLEGYIQPPGMGRVYLKGLTLAQSKNVLRSKFAQYYSFGPGEFEVTLTYSKVITVNVVGEVEGPGSMTIPATNTAFDALVAVGGPTDIGSVRNVKLLRNGVPPKEFDLYEYLKDPSVEGEFFLQDNDYIHVPIFERLVTIEGAVRRPMRYELKDDENVVSLVDYAGGFLENAYLKNVQLTRYINDEEVIIDLDFRDLENTDSDFRLYSGDIVTVGVIAKPFENFVEVSGSVEYPGKYELAAGMRLSDLLDQGVLAKEARRDIAYIYRTKADETVRLLRVNLTDILDNASSDANFTLEPKDKLQILNQISFVDKATISSQGALREPVTITYDPDENVRVSDLILLSNGLAQNAAEYAYIKRTDPTNAKNIDFIRVNLFNVITDTTAIDNRALKPNDQLIVYTKEEFVDQSNLVVTGAVRAPGEFEFDDGLRVTDLVYFSGGLKPEATTFAYINRLDLETQETQYIRVDLEAAMNNPGSADNVLMRPFDKLNIMSQTTFIDATNVDVTGSVRVPGSYPFHPTLSLKDALTMAGGLKFGAASNRVEVSRVIIRNNQPTQTTVAILEVDDNLNVISGGNNNNFQLQPYDEIIVRNVPDFELQENVTFEGEIQYPGTHPLLSDNETLTSVLDRAGGLTKEAFPEGATLFRAEEGVGYIVMNLKEAMKKKGKSRYDYILKPGDIISIPTKQDFVTISGATKAEELYKEEIIKDGRLAVPYHKGRRARYYVTKYAAGIGEEGKASKITVLHPNGELKKTKNFGIFLIHPKVRKGSEIAVGFKEPKNVEKDGSGGTKEEIDWGKVVADSIAQATAILSLILLIQRIN